MYHNALYECVYYESFTFSCSSQKCFYVMSK